MLSYLDGATGQMLLAVLAGGSAGVAVMLRMYSHRVMGIVSKKHRAKADEAQLQLLGERVEKVTAGHADAAAEVDADAPTTR